MSDSALKNYLIGVLENGTYGSNISFVSFVDGDEKTTTVSTDADKHVTISLGIDLSLSDVTVSGNYTINLGGKTLTIESNFVFAEGSALTVNGGETGGIIVFDGVSTTVNDGESYTINNSGIAEN